MLDCPTHQKKGLRIWEELGSGLLPVLGAHSPPPPPPSIPTALGPAPGCVPWKGAQDHTLPHHTVILTRTI